MNTPKELVINDIIKPMHIIDIDTERLSDLWNHKVFRKNVWDSFPYPYTLDDAKQRINHTREKLEKQEWERNYGIYIKSDNWDYQYAWNMWWQIKESGRKKHNYHLWYRLWEPYRGKWYMTMIVTWITQWMFEHIDYCHRIYALAFGWNKWSARVLEKSWFILEWTLREAIFREWEWYDEWVYGKLRWD